MKKTVAIVGAGVNGVCAAVALGELGHHVTLIDKGEPFAETSSKSSKLLHGGIRYLEHFHFGLVREALSERAWWLKEAPRYTTQRRFYMPIYQGMPRSRWLLYAGAKLYQMLAGRKSLGSSAYHSKRETLEANPHLSDVGLLGSVSYMDVQMDEPGLSAWLLDRAVSAGVELMSNTPVASVSTEGQVVLATGDSLSFDWVVNAAGPWASALLQASSIASNYRIELVRGSHLRFARTLPHPLVIQSRFDQRIIFLLPEPGGMLCGTTEVPHEDGAEVVCTADEAHYLLQAVEGVLREPLVESEITERFSGVRPIAYEGTGHEDFSSASRDSEIEVMGRLIAVFGGKWTSAMHLGQEIASKVR